MPRFRRMRLSSWGNFPVQECEVARPEKVRGVGEVVGDSAVSSVISRGLGRSYGDAALNEGAGVILHERLNRLLSFNAATGEVECEAGVTFAELLETFLPRGWWLPVTPGTKFVTVGGAIAADVHGKNHHVDGAISRYVQEITLLTGTGEVVRCSKSVEPDVFWATVGGMGLTGSILSARLELRAVESAYTTVEYRRAENLDKALELFATAMGRQRFSVAWLDCAAAGKGLGRSVLMCGDHTPLSELPERLRAAPLESLHRRNHNVPDAVPRSVLSGVTVRMLNAAYYHLHRDGRRVVPNESYFYPLDSILHWNRLYGRRGFQQYQVVLPHENSHDGLVQLLEALARSRRGSFLAVLKALGPQSEGMLSFPMPGWTLAVDMPQASGLDEFLHSLDRIVLEHGGRRYLAKDASMLAEDFQRMYPRLGEFREILERLDPQGRFQSSLSRRLGIRRAGTQNCASAAGGNGVLRRQESVR